MIGPIIKAETTPFAKVRLVIVFFGSNDAAINPDGSYRIKIERYAQNLREIAAAVQKINAKLIITGPAPFNAKQVDLPTDRDTRVFRKYAQVAGDVAAEVKAGFVNLWEEFMNSVGWDGDLDKTLPGEAGYDGPIDLSHLFTDGLHYRSDGYKLWHAAIEKQISTHFPELVPDALLPWTLPEWNTIDMDNLPDSLFIKDTSKTN
jgi:lysophospholipase L1-like esterase